MSQFSDKTNNYAAVRRAAKLRTRFAPSPTGYLHIGHARAAAQAFDFARLNDGQCLLRIEDIDHTRCKAELTTAIYEDLDWLGFDWPLPVRVQSRHYDNYARVIVALRERELIYRCFKTRKEIAADSVNGIYSGCPASDEAEHLAANHPFAWRLSMNAARDALGSTFDNLKYYESGVTPGWTQISPAQHGDVIIARKDIGTSYHLAVTHDDAAQNITHVVRGTDLKESTDIHVLLQTLMGWPVPDYHHHKLVLDEGGEKLSKRRGSKSIRDLRASGYSREEVLNRVTFLP